MCYCKCVRLYNSSNELNYAKCYYSTLLMVMLYMIREMTNVNIVFNGIFKSVKVDVMGSVNKHTLLFEVWHSTPVIQHQLF